MAKEKILVIDDEEDILDLVRYNLEKEGYQITCLKTGEEAIIYAQKLKPDLMLLDLMLPGVDGFAVCKLLKNDQETSQIPIIMLTAKGEESDIVTGLELGADDYISKPFSPKVLTARVRTVLRRHQTDQSRAISERFEIGDFIIDPGRFIITYKNQELDLTFTQFRLLQLLATKPGWVFTRYHIVDALRGEDYPVTERAVDVQIVGLRKKLGEGGKLIQTVRGVGYRFKED